ncbi:MAG: septal ring lytic transglycosylase RlpA family protein [Candidatus Zixiibacteriota bacterium]
MKPRTFLAIIIVGFICGLIGCSRAKIPPPITIPPPGEKKAPPPYEVGGKVYYPLGKVEDYKESGVASWYGGEFHGRRTSSGEIYNMYAGTAAHRILPFGTHVEVKNVLSGEKTTVRINDRGPFVKDRIIDLSYTGARDIGLIGPGTVPVELKVVGTSPSTPLYWTGSFTVQVGAFEDFRNATRLKEKLSCHYTPVYISPFDSPNGIIYRVRVGKYNTFEETLQTQKELETKGYQDTFIVVEQ